MGCIIVLYSDGIVMWYVHGAFDVQTAVTMFDLLDYYESCERLNISYNKNLGIRGWQACARFIKKVSIVTVLVFFDCLVFHDTTCLSRKKSVEIV